MVKSAAIVLTLFPGILTTFICLQRLYASKIAEPREGSRVALIGGIFPISVHIRHSFHLPNFDLNSLHDATPSRQPRQLHPLGDFTFVHALPCDPNQICHHEGGQEWRRQCLGASNGPAHLRRRVWLRINLCMPSIRDHQGPLTGLDPYFHGKSALHPFADLPLCFSHSGKGDQEQAVGYLEHGKEDGAHGNSSRSILPRHHS